MSIKKTISKMIIVEIGKNESTHYTKIDTRPQKPLPTCSCAVFLIFNKKQYKYFFKPIILVHLRVPFLN